MNLNPPPPAPGLRGGGVFVTFEWRVIVVSSRLDQCQCDHGQEEERVRLALEQVRVHSQPATERKHPRLRAVLGQPTSSDWRVH